MEQNEERDGQGGREGKSGRKQEKAIGKKGRVLGELEGNNRRKEKRWESS